MLRKVVHPRRQSSSARLRRSFRPVLHCLEDRWLPSTFTWFQNVDGNFNDAARWHDQNGNNGVPGAGDDAFINGGGFTVTSTVNNTVRSLNASCRLTLTGGTFTVGDAINTSSISELVVGSGAGFHVTAGMTSLTNGTENLGSFTVDAGAMLFFTGGTHHIDSVTALRGGGEYHLSSGALSIDTNVNAPPNFFLEGGTLTGTGTFTVTGTTMNWTGGAMSGLGGNTVIAADGTLTLDGPGRKDIRNGYSLVNNGTATWQGTGDLLSDSGAMITNNGTWNVLGDLNITEASGTGVFTNSATGVFTKVSGPGTLVIDDAFSNAGTVNINSGTLQLANGGYSTGAFNAVAGTTLTFTGGTQTLAAGASLTSAGLVQVNGGTVVVDAAVSVQSFELDNGTLHLTLNGMLNVGGDYSQRATGTNLIIDIGGTTPGAGYGQLNVAGTANLAGTPTVDLTNNFSPSVGDSYRILTFGSRNGVFGTENLQNLGTDRHFAPVYDPNDLTLNIVPS